MANDKATTAAYTGSLALDLDESQYGRGYGPCLEAAVGEEIQEITNAREGTRWPDYAQECVERGALSSLSVPVPVREAVHGAPNLHAVEADAFDVDARDVARAFTSPAAVPVYNMRLYETTRELAENLDRAMQTRAVIEQTKSILMSQRRCDATEAFSLLAQASQRHNRKGTAPVRFTRSGRGSGRCCGVAECLVLDRGQSAEAALPATAVVGPLDPGDDRQPELVSSSPALPVQDVVLQEREEGLHRGVVPQAPTLPIDDPTRPLLASVRTKAFERNWLPRSEWTTELSPDRSS